jgi:hypothetical protein
MSALGIEPRTDRLKADRSTAELRTLSFFGVERIELSFVGTKNQCLTTWLYPKIN